MRFYSWEYLLIFLPIMGFIIYWLIFKTKMKGYHNVIKYPDIKKLKIHTTSDFKTWLRRNLIYLKFIALFFMILAIARPQKGIEIREWEAKGIDIMLALDVSGSMRAEDFRPNRLAVAKKVLSDFVKGRKTDRIGLVVFAGESFTQSPLTLDYNIILEYIKQIKFDMIEDGTAIGMAIATCVERLKNSPSKSKIIILLTDGENNAGLIDPITASQMAAAFNIKIYTVGVGSLKGAPIPIPHPIFGKTYARNYDGSLFITKLDEETLKKIAQITGGKYFRATDENSLKEIYKKIDSMEKVKIKVKEYVNYKEQFPVFLTISLVILVLYFLLDNFIMVRIP